MDIFHVFSLTHYYTSSGTYYCPNLKKYDQFVDYIQELPSITRPSIFGMNENADLIKEQQESDILLTSVLSTQVCTLYNNFSYDFLRSYWTIICSVRLVNFPLIVMDFDPCTATLVPTGFALRARIYSPICIISRVGGKSLSQPIVAARRWG